MTDKFSKPILRNLRTSLQDILKAECFGDKIPFEYTLGNCSFDDDQAKLQILITCFYGYDDIIYLPLSILPFIFMIM